MENSKYISSRGDRYGANYIPAICYIFLCESVNNDCLYHNCDKNCNRYVNTILHNYLLDKTNKCNDRNIISKDIHKKNKGWITKYITKEIYEKTNNSFPDIFYKSNIYNEIRNIYINRYGEKSFTGDSCVIHVRLDDVRKRANGNNQRFIGELNLINLINTVLNKFKLDIFLITTNNIVDKKICSDALIKSNFNQTKDLTYYILGSDDIDYDIYLMMTSKVLITSCSTFSFIPAILNENIVYSYCKWPHYCDLLGTEKSQKFVLLDK